MSLADEIERLERMRAAGTLTEEEFTTLKARLTAGSTDGEANARNWLVALHLSQLAGWAVPYAGFVVPILLWQLEKDRIPGMDAHGRVVVNWIISATIYSIVALLALMCLLGIPALIALAIVGVAFPVIGAIKASNGELWKYPLAIPFF